jgi:RHS repeat-associated protein
VGYVHALGIDQPLAVLRFSLYGSYGGLYVVYPHTNWRGQYEVGSRPNGDKCSVGSSCINISWPGASTTVDGVVGAASDGAAWFGSLIAGNSDGSGMSYLRNRYYDPQTGRFTQEDPIGLAGGMNLYGFAGGDRVNFGDPFGLCPLCLPLPGVTEAIKRAADEGLRNSLMAQMEDMALSMPIAGMSSAGRAAGQAASGWNLGSGKTAAKWSGQMAKRGWTGEAITEALQKGERFDAENLVNKGNPAGRYVHPTTGRSVVIDEKTREVIHIGGDGFKYKK